MAKPFKWLVEKARQVREEHYQKVKRWLFLEEECRRGAINLGTEQHLEKVELEEELFK